MLIGAGGAKGSSRILCLSTTQRTPRLACEPHHHPLLTLASLQPSLQAAAPTAPLRCCPRSWPPPPAHCSPAGWQTPLRWAPPAPACSGGHRWGDVGRLLPRPACLPLPARDRLRLHAWALPVALLQAAPRRHVQLLRLTLAMPYLHCRPSPGWVLPRAGAAGRHTRLHAAAAHLQPPHTGAWVWE